MGRISLHVVVTELNIVVPCFTPTTLNHHDIQPYTAITPSVLNMHSPEPPSHSTLHLTSGSSTSCKLPATVAKCIRIVAKCCAHTSCDERNTSGKRAEDVSSER